VELTYAIFDFFIPYIKSEPKGITNVIRALKIMIDEAEYYEEYERADLFQRVKIKYEDLFFL
jgi:hypothetical protein